MKRNLCKNISKVLMITMLALCMLAFMYACQSEKKLSLNNYKKYVSVSYDPTFDSKNGHIVIIDLIVIQKVNKDDKLFNVTIKCSYVINNYEGELSENLGDLNSAYSKEIKIPDSEGSSSHSGHVTVLEISGTAQGSVNVGENTTLLVVGTLFLILLILGLCVARGLRFSAKFDKIQTGMSYDEVIKILGNPSNDSNVENISTCVWRKHVLRGWIMIRAVTFKDGTVISKTY